VLTADADQLSFAMPSTQPGRIGERWLTKAQEMIARYDLPPLEIVDEEWVDYEWGDEQHEGRRGYWVFVCAGKDIFGEPFTIRLNDKGLRRSFRHVR
jgi:hypothetical protein